MFARVFLAVLLFAGPALAEGRATSKAAKPGKRSEPAAEAHEQARLRRQDLASVRSWAVQLRYLDRAAIGAMPLDLIVIDHAPHPKRTGETPFTTSEIAELKAKPDGTRRIVLSYLSIGEAERYRYYWKPEWEAPETRPAWLGTENPLWPGNYLVKFADPEWQAIIFGTPESYLDRIIAAGFDGVYLDRSDAFQDPGQSETEAAEAMVRYLSRLTDHARRLNPRFLIIMQNAEELVQYGALRQRLDGIAKEDLSYGNDNSSLANNPEMVRESLSYLRKAKRAGLAVFTLEYLSDDEKIASVRRLAAREGFALYITERLLDKVNLEGALHPTAPRPAAKPPG